MKHLVARAYGACAFVALLSAITAASVPWLVAALAFAACCVYEMHRLELAEVIGDLNEELQRRRHWFGPEDFDTTAAGDW